MPKEKSKFARQPAVQARVSPEVKLRIDTISRETGHVESKVIHAILRSFLEKHGEKAADVAFAMIRVINAEDADQRERQRLNEAAMKFDADAREQLAIKHGDRASTSRAGSERSRRAKGNE